MLKLKSVEHVREPFCVPRAINVGPGFRTHWGMAWYIRRDQSQPASQEWGAEQHVSGTGHRSVKADEGCAIWRAADQSMGLAEPRGEHNGFCRNFYFLAKTAVPIYEFPLRIGIDKDGHENLGCMGWRHGHCQWLRVVSLYDMSLTDIL